MREREDKNEGIRENQYAVGGDIQRQKKKGGEGEFEIT
jgi:hypothetical protein